jgi:hypothetical protein
MLIANDQAHTGLDYYKLRDELWDLNERLVDSLVRVELAVEREQRRIKASRAAEDSPRAATA